MAGQQTRGRRTPRRIPGPSVTRARAANIEYARLYELGRQGERPFEWSVLDEPSRQAWEAGRSDARRPTVTPRRPKSATRKRAATYATKRGRRARSLRAAKRPLKTAVRQLQPTAAAQVSSGTQMFFLSLVVVVLYVLVTNVAPLTGFLAGVGRAVEWLGSPTSSIPYKR